MRRWEAPLFTLRPQLGNEADVLHAVVASVLDDAPAAAARQGGAATRELAPTMATSNPTPSSTNLLFEIDRAAQEVGVHDAHVRRPAVHGDAVCSAASPRPSKAPCLV